MLDPIQYEFRFFQNTLADPEPGAGAGAETSIFRLQLRPKVSAPAPQPSRIVEEPSEGSAGGFSSRPKWSLAPPPH